MKFLQKTWGGLAALAKKVIQKQVIEKYRLSARVKKIDSPCVHLTLTPHPISTKRSYGCLSSLCSQKIVDSSHLCLTLTHHAILTKYKTKKKQIIGTGGLIVLTKNIAFTSFTITSHMSYNFLKKYRS